MNHRTYENRMARFDEESSADRKKRAKREMQKAQGEIWRECLPVVQRLLDGETLGQRLAQPKRSRRRAIAA